LASSNNPVSSLPLFPVSRLQPIYPADKFPYASRLYLKTKDPLLVSYALGHSSFNTTIEYIRDDSFNFRPSTDEIFKLD